MKNVILRSLLIVLFDDIDPLYDHYLICSCGVMFTKLSCLDCKNLFSYSDCLQYASKCETNNAIKKSCQKSCGLCGK